MSFYQYLLQALLFVSGSFYGPLWREYMTLFKSPRGGAMKPQKRTIPDPLSAYLRNPRAQIDDRIALGLSPKTSESELIVNKFRIDSL